MKAREGKSFQVRFTYIGKQTNVHPLQFARSCGITRRASLTNDYQLCTRNTAVICSAITSDLTRCGYLTLSSALLCVFGCRRLPIGFLDNELHSNVTTTKNGRQYAYVCSRTIANERRQACRSQDERGKQQRRLTANINKSLLNEQ